MHLVQNDVHTGWVDVSIPALNEGLGWNWIFTVVGPGDADADVSELVLDHDVAIWRIWNEETYWFDENPCTLTSPDVKELSTEQRAEFDEDPTVLLGWKTETITKAVAEWFATQAARPDIIVTYDPDMGFDRRDEAQELLNAVKSGIEPTYEISPGVMATDRFMDQLLVLDPDEAADLTETLLERLPKMGAGDGPPSTDHL
jgi:hypothetical protein